jgi:hypothetical protein
MLRHGWGSVISLTGPDREGRIAYLLDRNRSDHLWVDDAASRSPRQLCPRRSADPSFTIGELALSPVGARLAFQKQRVPGQAGSARIEELAILDLATGSVEVVWTGSCDRIAWFPDGRRLAFVEDGESGASIHVLDVGSRAVSFTSEPIPGLNGLWVGPGGTHLYGSSRSGTGWALGRIDLATGKRERWALSGLEYPIAFSEDGMVVGYGLPTAGSKQEYTRSPWNVPSPKHAIKLYELASSRSCTVSAPGGWLELFSAGEIGD